MTLRGSSHASNNGDTADESSSSSKSDDYCFGCRRRRRRLQDIVMFTALALVIVFLYLSVSSLRLRYNSSSPDETSQKRMMGKKGHNSGGMLPPQKKNKFEQEMKIMDNTNLRKRQEKTSSSSASNGKNSEHEIEATTTTNKKNILLFDSQKEEAEVSNPPPSHGETSSSSSFFPSFLLDPAKKGGGLLVTTESQLSKHHHLHRKKSNSKKKRREESEEDNNSARKGGEDAADNDDSSNPYFLLYNVETRLFLARAIDTNVETSSDPEKIFKFQFSSKYQSWTIQGHTRLYLTRETNNKMTLDRSWARSYEQWHVKFLKAQVLTSEQRYGNNREKKKSSSSSSDDEKEREEDAVDDKINQKRPMVKNDEADVPKLRRKSEMEILSRVSPEHSNLVVYIALQSRVNSKYVTVSNDGFSLIANQADPKEATKFLLLRVPSSVCTTDVSCWGAVPSRKEKGGGGKEGDGTRKLVLGEKKRGKNKNKFLFPIFGSPKSLPSLQPADASDPYDTFLIAKRTMSNWAALPGMQTLIFTNDENTQELLQQIQPHNASSYQIQNRNVVLKTNKEQKRTKNKEEEEEEEKEGWSAPPPVIVNSEFEMKMGRPTYRGLFARAFELCPEAEAVMYSNADILYTPSLAETIQTVEAYIEKEKQRVLSGPSQGKGYQVRGWMIIGQRVNYKVPASWAMPTLSSSFSSIEEGEKHLDNKNKDEEINKKFSWVRDIEHIFAKQGELFQSNAEDYFIVSRGLFEFATKTKTKGEGGAGDIPDFIVGGVAFDNWFVSKANRLALEGKAIVVDASKTIIALHQNHHQNVKDSHKGKQSEYNAILAAKNGGVSTYGKTADALYATERHPVTGAVTMYDKHRLLYR